MEKILKVNSTDPKVEELRKRLASLQQKPGAPQGQPAPGTSETKPTGTNPMNGQVPAGSSKDDIGRLQELSFEEQKRLMERNNPELRFKEERTLNLVMNQISEIITINTETAKKIKEFESKQIQLEKNLESFKDKHEELLNKMNSIDSRLEKFMGLYEIVTNQYNPFATDHPIPAPRPAPRASQPTPPNAKAVQVEAPVSREPQRIVIEDNITKENAEVIVGPEDAAAAQTRFKRVEEMLADLQEKQAEKPAPSKEHPAGEASSAPPAALTKELHEALMAFEERLKAQFDRSLQEKLHSQFSKLETSIQAEVRDALKAEIEAVQKDDTEVQSALAELQSLLQSREGPQRTSVESEFADLTSGMGRVRDEVRTLPPNLYFRVVDGSILKDLADLREAVRRMSAGTFMHHVTTQRNDFAAWVEHALLMPNLATLMRENPTQEGMIQAIIAHDGLND